MLKAPSKSVALAGCAVVISGAAATVSITRAVNPSVQVEAKPGTRVSADCKDCGTMEGTSLVGLVEGLSSDAADRMTRMEEGIARRSKTTIDDAMYLHECAHGVDDVIVQRWAIALASDRLATCRYESDARETLERVVVDALYHDNWRVRRTGLTTAQECGLIARDDVAERVRALREDERPEVAARASYVPLPGDRPSIGE